MTKNHPVTTDDIETIRAELANCRSQAREQGWEGDDIDYEYTVEDLDAVVEALGYKPTRAQWAAAGIGYVGGRHTNLIDA